MSMIPAVLKAHGMGFHIFPVARGGKVPHREAGQWGMTATNDLSRILYFWTNVDREANIGIACKPSSLLVIDLDQAKEDWNLKKTDWAYLHEAYGPRVSGEDLLDEMRFKLGDGVEFDYADTYSVRTGSGGLHLYYQWPDHWPRISQASPVKGVVDVRGNGGQWGGYVLGEGSRTDAGPYVVDQTWKLALPPTWIRKLVAERPQQPRIHRPRGIMQPGAVSYSGLVASVQNAAEGNRNNSLVWAARTMCEEGAQEEEAIRVLAPAAESAGLGYMEIERTIRSAYRTQQYKEGR